jgi:hypothetical protein
MRDSDDPAASEPAIAQALRQVLEPLAQLALAHDLKLPQLIELMKQALVHAALRSLRPAAPERAASRISAATGVHRKDAKRLLDAPAPTLGHARSFAGEAFALWTTQRRYLEADGSPKALPRIAGRGASFDELARRITTDVHPRTVLEEMVRLGVAELGADDRVRLCSAAFVPRGQRDRMLRTLANNLGDHAAAAVSNVLAEQPPFVERSIYADELRAESVRALMQLTERQWRQLYGQVAPKLQQWASDDDGAADATQRVRLGLYVYAEQVADSVQSTTSNAEVKKRRTISTQRSKGSP